MSDMMTPNLPTADRGMKVLEFWIGGVNSLVHPCSIPDNQYAWAENVMTRGGIPQTRPGYRFIVSLPGSNLQGMTIFQPSTSIPFMVVAIDGLIYAAPQPYKRFSAIPGLVFSAGAPIINFQAALQSVVNNPDGSLTVITPKKVLMIQDGATQAGYWDGTTARKLDSTVPASETPSGLWMAWNSSRLWVSRGSQVFVSDIANPLSFTENTYLAERSNFELPADCTGLVETTDLAGVLAFTKRTTTAFQSSIRDRSTWQQTPGFQTLLLASIGCVSGRSIVSQYGLTHWMSQQGVISLDEALASKHTSRLATGDGEMTRSKRKLSNDLSGVCGVAFENLLLMSVPSGSRGNTHTWVQDQAPTGEAGQTGTNWTSIWTGVRPVSWAINPTGDRCFFASSDSTHLDSTPIHIWEAFDPCRDDNLGGKIACQFETAMVSNPMKQRFCYAEIDLCEIYGDVDLQVYFGGIKGQWIKVLDTQFHAERGCFTSSLLPLVTKTSLIETYRPQSRTVKTTDFSPQGLPANIETTDIPGVDKSHGLLLQWTGRMGIRKITIVTAPEPQNQAGGAHASEDGERNAIAEDGSEVPLPES